MIGSRMFWTISLYTAPEEKEDVNGENKKDKKVKKKTKTKPKAKLK